MKNSQKLNSRNYRVSDINILPSIKSNIIDILLITFFPFSFLNRIHKINVPALFGGIYLLLIGFIIFGKNLSALKIFIPLVAVDIYLRLSLRKLKNKIKILRVHNDKAKEEDLFSIKYYISNPSPFRYNNFTLINHFEGHHAPLIGTSWIKYFHSLPKNTRKYEERKVSLNHGMGEKTFGKIFSFVTDEVGFHRLKFVNEEINKVNVYPKVYSSRRDRITPDPTSRNFGDFDTYHRGENVNFYGVREYVQGDNIKKINWKLSLKHNSLIVNEFEKNVNGKICIAINEDIRVHMGEGSFSTLEYCKDFALSLCHQHIKNNNEIEFLTHQFPNRTGSGTAYVQNLEMILGRLLPAQFTMTQVYHRGSTCPQEIIKFCSRLLKTVTPTTTVYLLTGIIPGKIYRYYTDYFAKIAKRSHRLIIININGTNELMHQLKGQEAFAISGLSKEIGSEKERLIRHSHRNRYEVKFIEVSSSHNYDKTIKEGLQFK